MYYISLADDLSAVKLGYTCNLRNRLSALQLAHARPLQILAYTRVQDVIAAEQAAKAKWNHLHLRGEWYAMAPDLRQYILELQQRESQIL